MLNIKHIIFSQKNKENLHGIYYYIIINIFYIVRQKKIGDKGFMLCLKLTYKYIYACTKFEP